MSYHHLNLDDVEDATVANGLDHRWEARIARTVSRDHWAHALPPAPGKRSPFVHRHMRSEEVYLVLSGSGRVKLGDDVHDIRSLDAIRVAPELPRAFEAGPDGLEFLAFGPHVDADGVAVEDPWVK